LRGDPRAVDAYGEAHARGRDPQPGRALLRLQEGDAAAAATSVRTALAAVGLDPLRRAPLCVAAVETSVAAGRLPDAAAAAAELTSTASTYATSGLEAMATDARGALLLEGGRAAGAMLLPHERRATVLLAAAVPVHLAVSIGWAAVMAESQTCVAASTALL